MADSSGVPDWVKYFGTGAAGGAAIGSMFGNNKNPYDVGSKYYNQIPGQIHGAYDPYINEGQGLGLKNFYGKMMNDPGSVISQLGKGYTNSPGYQFEKTEGLNSVNNAAAAGGMLGTAQHQEQAGQLATNLANQDYDKYMDRVTGMMGQGIKGAQGLYDTGYDASKSLAENISRSLMNQGNAAFAGQASKNQSNRDMWGNIIGAAGTIGSLWG